MILRQSLQDPEWKAIGQADRKVNRKERQAGDSNLLFHAGTKEDMMMNILETSNNKQSRVMQSEQGGLVLRRIHCRNFVSKSSVSKGRSPQVASLTSATFLFTSRRLSRASNETSAQH